MLSYDEALKIVLSHSASPVSEPVTIEKALGRVIANDIDAPFDMPRFDNSAVDGYAVSGNDGERVGGRLNVVGVVHAGDRPISAVLETGLAIRVMTGAAVPPGTSKVVMQEDVSRNGEWMEIICTTKPGRNVRKQASEIARGDRVLSRGALVSPPTLALLASLGMANVSVFANRRIGVLATGDELVIPGAVAAEGQIFESNSYALQGVLNLLGMSPEVRRCKDTLEATVGAMHGLLDKCDVLITSGGVSVGEHDFVRGALCELGFDILVPKVAIKPGKPFLFARRVGDGKVVFGLPGNPMSALCCFTVLVMPYLEESRGRAAATPVECCLHSELKNNGDRFEFVPGRVFVIEGNMWAEPMPTPGSHSVSGLVGMDGFIQSPAGSRLKKGESVQVTRLPWGSLI